MRSMRYLHKMNKNILKGKSNLRRMSLRKKRSQVIRNSSRNLKITISTRIKEDLIHMIKIRKSLKEDLISLNLGVIKVASIIREVFKVKNKDSMIKREDSTRITISIKEASKIKEDFRTREDSKEKEERISIIIKSSKNKIYKILLLIFLFLKACLFHSKDPLLCLSVV